MKTQAVFAGLILLGAASLFAASQTPQVKAPKDPELIDAQGYQKLLQQYHGRPLMVTFWATWCEPCRDEYPMLNELAKQYTPLGLTVMGVNLDQDGDLILMRRFIARYKPVFRNYREKKGDEAAFFQGVQPGWSGAIPASFFYAEDGQQIGRVMGASGHQTYETAIRNLLGSGTASGAAATAK
jgi:thiol-disulfide isomerase/thioredoxin